MTRKRTVIANGTAITQRAFLYCEATEGGMTPYMLADKPPTFLLGWMEPGSRAEDQRLVRWMKDADVGDTCFHRLGLMIRVKDR